MWTDGFNKSTLLINNLRTHSRSVFKGFKLSLKINLPMEKINGVFTFRNQLLDSILGLTNFS